MPYKKLLYWIIELCAEMTPIFIDYIRSYRHFAYTIFQQFQRTLSSSLYYPHKNWDTEHTSNIQNYITNMWLIKSDITIIVCLTKTSVISHVQFKNLKIFLCPWEKLSTWLKKTQQIIFFSGTSIPCNLQSRKNTQKFWFRDQSLHLFYHFIFPIWKFHL